MRGGIKTTREALTFFVFSSFSVVEGVRRGAAVRVGLDFLIRAGYTGLAVFCSLPFATGFGRRMLLSARSVTSARPAAADHRLSHPSVLTRIPAMSGHQLFVRSLEHHPGVHSSHFTVDRCKQV